MCKINKAIKLFKEKNFLVTKDKIGFYYSNSILYYKSISIKILNKLLNFCPKNNLSVNPENIVICFNLFLFDDEKELDGWVAEYLDINKIGTEKPVNINELGSPNIANNEFNQFLEIIKELD